MSWKSTERFAMAGHSGVMHWIWLTLSTRAETTKDRLFAACDQEQLYRVEF